MPGGKKKIKEDERWEEHRKKLTGFI